VRIVYVGDRVVFLGHLFSGPTMTFNILGQSAISDGALHACGQITYEDIFPIY
jgi:hypothetical protein